MPIITIETSVAASAIPENFKTEFIALAARVSGLPESTILIIVKPGLDMTWGGGPEPCAHVHFLSLGRVGAIDNARGTREYGKLLEERLGVSTERTYVTFTNKGNDYIGYDGLTFGERQRIATRNP